MTDTLEKLVAKLLDGHLSDSERSQLNQLLREEESRIRFVELSKVHYCLAQRSMSTVARSTAIAASAVHDQILAGTQESAPECNGRLTESPKSNQISQSQVPRGRILLGGPMLRGAIAALFVISCFSAIWYFQSRDVHTAVEDKGGTAGAPRHSTPDGRSEVAGLATTNLGFAARILSVSEDASWGSTAVPGDFLMRLAAGEQLDLTRGVAKLEFAAGAFAVLTAPVELEILGPDEVLLRGGKLTGRSVEGDFIVQTPSAYVVDVGTAFGVFVDEEEATDVVVFDGEVYVRRNSQSKEKVRLTKGMSLHADLSGLGASTKRSEMPAFAHEFKGDRPGSLGANELSLIDIVCGSEPGEYRFAGSIDPETGAWSTLPWSEAKGVRGRLGEGDLVPVTWNRWVHGVLVPLAKGDRLVVDLQGGSIKAPAISGGAWGPVWARRRIPREHDPLTAMVDRDIEGFWGAGTTTALLDRSRWVRDGIVGLHANVGVTIDLNAVRDEYASSIESFRGVLAHLEKSHVSQPFHPQAKASFQIYIDRILRYERTGFCRLDGDAMFGIELSDDDQLMTLLVTDGGDGPVYDHVILLDPILETRND